MQRVKRYYFDISDKRVYNNVAIEDLNQLSFNGAKFAKSALKCFAP